MSDLPYAAEANVSLLPEELEILRLQYYKEIEQGHVTTQTKFNYGWALIKSPSSDQQTEGIKLLQELYSSTPDHRRECSYYIAVGYYKLRNWDNARRFNDLLLRIEPNNLQAQSLRTMIDNAQNRDGYIGLGMLAGAAALTGMVVATLVRRSRK